MSYKEKHFSSFWIELPIASFLNVFIKWSVVTLLSDSYTNKHYLEHFI